jgi:hypothetical protein
MAICCVGKGVLLLLEADMPPYRAMVRVVCGCDSRGEGEERSWYYGCWEP